MDIGGQFVWDRSFLTLGIVSHMGDANQPSRVFILGSPDALRNTTDVLWSDMDGRV